MNILYIEDQKAITEWVKTLFDGEHNLTTTDTITEAIELIKVGGEKIDGIITDDGVNDGSVVNRFREIRSIYKGPVILMSASIYSFDDLTRMGFLASFPKPNTRHNYEDAVHLFQQAKNENKGG